MKKIMCVILATAALAACTKSETQYEPAAEIGFKAAVKNITKAAHEAGTLSPSQGLNVWAYWDKDGAIETTVADYTAYSDSYLDNASFVHKGNNAWGGNGVAYPWPANGALVFAGYTTPTTAETVATGYNVTYNLANDEMVFTNYTQSSQTSSTFDLCWFNHTAASHNNRATGAAVDVTLSHALTWITIQVKGKSETSLPVTADWTIKEVILNDVKTVGTGTCTGATATTNNVVTPATATWTFANDATEADMTIYNESGQKITSSAAKVENTTAGTVVIPQTPTSLTVKWSYPVGSTTQTDEVEIDLTLDGLKDADGNAITKITEWKAGTHYIYTLVFDSNEILVAPSYCDWAEVNQTVTVE